MRDTDSGDKDAEQCKKELDRGDRRLDAAGTYQKI